MTESRCTRLARHIIENGCTVREAAAWYGISKSTVHKDVTDRLKGENPGLYAEVKEILDRNKAERHIRGGEATRLKYMEKNRRNTACI
jgi:putative DeoR family transcriptional regulator (stage III sporulation protein D)